MHKRIPIHRLIAAALPTRPECFADDALWASWLRSAHESGLRIVRRADRRPSAQRRTGNQDPVRYEMLPARRVPYCDGCLAEHRALMQSEGRCHPCDPDVLNRGPD